jgi:hypothetical protein
MTTARSRFAWILSFVISLALPIDVANAGSRFETGSSTPVHSSAHLDFTIIVPEFVWLQSEAVEHPTGKSMHLSGIVSPQSRTWRTIGNGGDIVRVNAGWTKSESSTPRAAIENTTVDFAVAAP